MFGKTKEKKNDLEKIVAGIEGGEQIVEKLKKYSSKELKAMSKFFSDQNNLFISRYAKNQSYRYILNFMKDYTPSKEDGNHFSMTVTIKDVDTMQNLNTSEPSIMFTVTENNGNVITIGGSTPTGGCKWTEGSEFIILLRFLEVEAEEKEEAERKKAKDVH